MKAMSDTLQERYGRARVSRARLALRHDVLRDRLRAHPYPTIPRWHWGKRAMLRPEYRELEDAVDRAKTEKFYWDVRVHSLQSAIRREQAVREARAKFDDLEPELQALWKVLDAWWETVEGSTKRIP